MTWTRSINFLIIISLTHPQAALCKALKQNLIMCGASGIGKTHVAMSLLREADYSEGRYVMDDEDDDPLDLVVMSLLFEH